MLLPLVIVISLGANKLLVLIKESWLKYVTVIFLTTVSLFLLWRGYFVLLPNERARVWGYGYKELAEFINNRPKERFVIDQSRIKPVYIELAFFNKYPPEKMHQAVDPSIKENYYSEVVFDSFYQLGNIDIRKIEWQEDIYQEQIIIGDELSISNEQAEEHFLKKVFEVEDPIGSLIFRGYKTNPEEKCRSNSQNIHCQ